MAPAPAGDPRLKWSNSFDRLRRDDAGDQEDFTPAEPKGDRASGRKRKRNKGGRGKLLQPWQSLSSHSSSELSTLELEVAAAATNGGPHCHKLDLPPIESENSSEAANGSLDDTCCSRVGDNPAPLVVLSPLLRQRTTAAINFEADAEPEPAAIKKIENEVGKTFPGLPPAFDPSSGAHWRQIMNAGDEYVEEDFSPVQHVMDELRDGAALEITTRTGSEQSRERVYNVLFNVPWRCELLIDVGFFVCLDSFLSLLTVTPLRLLMVLPNRIRNFRTVRANDWCDLCCLLILLAGVKALQQAEISYIYHSIRFEPNIKLYVIYNMLEVFDKLFQSFGVDVLEVLFSSAASCTAEGKPVEFLRLLFDQCIAIGCFIVHSFIIMFEGITLAAALHHAATNRSLLMLLMSNNFAEIKSNVFKRFNKQNMHSLAHNDTVERFHILTCLFFVFVQNTTTVEGPWMSSFFLHAAMVMVCESFVDLIKHSFLAKFNSVEPAAYTEFLRTLCEQVVDRRRKNAEKSLHFVPLGPACVLIRVLLPLYFSSGSLWKSVFLFGGTFTILGASKIVVAVLLHRYSAWYLRRSCDPEKHSHAD